MVELDRRKQSQRDVPYGKKRYDIVVTAQNAGYRMSQRAAHDFILNLKTKYWLRPVAEAVDEEAGWAEVYCKAEPTSHEMFTPRGFQGNEPVFLEAAIYFGQEAVELDYPQPKRVWFYLEFRGCLFKEPIASFKKLFKDILHIRPEIQTRPFKSLPEHRVVESYDDEDDLLA